ncbi:hypothetical protein [Staphylococcus epidermidis]|uniref:hypothetical protein n=1 Tax=Staphylococcus epidermidis TaxID=1282 RepID=UPI0016429930|nr:hypothetical protein [Staphylococcus epidermidis]
MDRENRVRRGLKEGERIKKYLIRNNGGKRKIREIGGVVKFLDEELKRERIIKRVRDVYVGNK